MIVAAAIATLSLTITIPAPTRHIDIAIAMSDHGLDAWDEQTFIRGFIDETGNFYTRKQALKHARSAGQHFKHEPNSNLGLFTEDLW